MASVSQPLPYTRRRQRVIYFHETSKFQDIQTEFLKAETVATILEGMSGTGKSEIALNLALRLEQKLKSDGNSNYIICMVNSSSEDMLRNDLQRFCGDLQLSNLKISSASCFRKIYDALNKEPYAGTKKLFLFDDMNLLEKSPDSMLNCTVLACLLYLANGDLQHRENWKFLVTTKHRCESDLTQLPAAKTFKIAGFLEKDTVDFFKGLKLSSDQIGKLHSFMDGSPLGLSIAKKELKGQSVEEYIEQVLECAEEDLKAEDQDADSQGNVIASIAKSLRPLVQERDKHFVFDLLRCILYFNEKSITDQLLLSCMEIIAPEKKMGFLKSAVAKFCDKMYEHFVATGDGDDGKNGFTVHQLVMKALRLLVRHKDPKDEQQSNCRRALTALCRCMDVDGRFHEKCNLKTTSHAMSVVKFLTEQIEEKPTFCDVTIKIMHAALLCAISYADIRTRAGFAQGQRRLLKARDDVCMLVCGKDFGKLKERAGSDAESASIPQRIGEKLYNGCKDLMPDPAYKQYVGNVALFQRLTERDCTVLGLNHEELKKNNGHLSESKLEKLREAGKALKNDTMEQIYAAEFTASIFCLLARLHAFATEESDNTVQDSSIQYAQIATAIYDLIDKEHRVIILNKVTVRRSEELMCRMKLLANQPQMQEADKILAHKLLAEFEVLSHLKGKAFENGLLRSDLEVDNYHQMLCLEGMMRSHGLLYKAGVQSSYDDGEQLFKTCKECGNLEERKYPCLSNLYQHYADFLNNCKQEEKAIRMVIQAIRFLGLAKEKSASADIPRPEILEGRFTELCDMMRKYAATPNLRIGLTSEETDYLEKLCSACQRREKTDEESIIKSVLDARRMHQPTEMDEI